MPAEHHGHRQRPERTDDEGGAPAERDREQRQRQPAHQDGGRDRRLLDPEREALALHRHLVGHEQVDGGLRHGVRQPGQDQERVQHDQRVREQRRSQQAGARLQHASAHGAQRARALRHPAAGPGADRPGEEEDRHAGGHRLDAHVEIAADLKRQRADQEAGQHGRRPGRDREQ
jgi:hypothetical protein